MNYVRRQIAMNGGLLVAALASGLVATAAIRWNAPRNSSITDRQALLPQLSNEELDSITLTRGGRTIHMVHNHGNTSGQSWFSESPRNRAGDVAVIDAAVAALRELRIVRQMPGNSPNDKSGSGVIALEEPLFVWQLGFGNHRLRLSFGPPALGFRGGTFVALTDPSKPGTEIYVVDGDPAALDLNPEQLLESRLVRRDPQDVREISLSSRRGDLHIRLDERRQHWFEAKLPSTRVDTQRVESLLDALTSLRAQRFLDVETKLQGSVVESHFVVKLLMAKPASEVDVEFLGRCDTSPELTSVRVSDGAATLACADLKNLTNLLQEEPPTWRDSQLFAVRIDQVESISANVDSRKFDLRREGMGFMLGNASPVKVDAQSGNDFLAAVLSAHGQLTSSGTDSTATVPDSRSYISVRSSVIGSVDDYQEKVLLGARTDDGGRFVRRLEDNAVLKVDEATATLLRIDDLSLKNRTIIQVDPDLIQHVEIRVRGKKVMIRPDRLDALKDQLADLRANKWLPDRPRNKTPQEITQLDFDVVSSSEPIRHHLLHLATDSKGAAYCWLDEQTGYFEPPSALVNTVRNLSDR